MCNATITVVRIGWEELSDFKGNLSIPSVEKLIEEAFKAEPYVQIADEERVWHKSEMSMLLQHIQKRMRKGGEQ